MVKIRFVGNIEAIIKDYKWQSKDKSLESALNASLSPFGPSGADPDPDYNAAIDAIDKLGGEIIGHEPIESKEGEVY